MLWLTILAGCSAVNAPDITVTPLGAGRQYPAIADSVPIPLHAAASVACPYEELAALTVEGPAETRVHAALIATARSLGAHAILGYTQSRREMTIGTIAQDRHVRSGTAVRFTSTECMR